MIPFDYGLCDRTVTLYGLRNGEVIRKVAGNCHFSPEHCQQVELTGKSRLKKFLLIIPENLDVMPGDRVYDGVGPKTVNWTSFLPDIEPRVYEIGYVKPCFWNGELCHVQAGQK